MVLTGSSPFSNLTTRPRESPARTIEPSLGETATEVNTAPAGARITASHTRSSRDKRQRELPPNQSVAGSSELTATAGGLDGFKGSGKLAPSPRQIMPPSVERSRK